MEQEFIKWGVLQGGFVLYGIVITVMWFGERKERIENCKQLFDIGKRSVEGGLIQAQSMDKLTAAIERRSNR